VSGTNDAGRKIATCIDILMTVAEEDPKASFAWVGAQGNNDSSERETKRFKVWLKVTYRIFQPARWRPRPYRDKSACLILRRNTHSTKHIINVLRTAKAVLC
jgi:hypothetical protein